MSAALQPQPATCASCGKPFVEPFCPHVQTALAALAADPRELRWADDYFAKPDGLFAGQLLDEVDAIVNAPTRPRRYSATDLRRGFCPTAAYYAVRRG